MQGIGFSSGNIGNNNIALNSSTELRLPARVEEGNFGLNRKIFGQPPATPSTNQEKGTHPEPSSQLLPIKTFFPKTIEELKFSEHKPPILLAWPCNKPFSAPNSNFSLCLASLCIGHRNLHSVTFLGYLGPISMCMYVGGGWGRDGVRVGFPP